MPDTSADDVEQVLSSLEDLLEKIESEHGGRSRSLLPASLARIAGTADLPGLIESAKGSVNDIRGILDIDDEYSTGDTVYVSDTAVMAINELTTLLEDIAVELEDEDDEELADLVDRHVTLLDHVVENSADSPDRDPATRAIEEMQSSIESSDLGGTGGSSETSGSSDAGQGPTDPEDAEKVTDIAIGDGENTTHENESASTEDDPVGVSVDDELDQIKSQLGLEDEDDD